MNENLRLLNFQINLQEICRTCLMVKNDLREIVCFIPLLKKCTSIQIDLEDELPKLICFECMNKLNNAIEFWRQCEVSEKILLQLRQIPETSSIFHKEKEAYSSPHNAINTIKINKINSESTHNENEDISNTCGKKKIFETFDLITIVGEFSEDTVNENENILIIPKIQNVNLKSNYNTSKKIDDDSDFDDQPVSETFIKENSESVKKNIVNTDVDNNDFDRKSFSEKLNIKSRHSDFENCESLCQSSTEYIDLKKKNRIRKTNGLDRKLNHKKNKSEIKNYDDTINNEKNDTVNIGLQCPQCGKSFELIDDLEIHKLQHKKFDDLICPKCSMSFGNERNLKRHLNTHMVNKPFKCDYCEKSFVGSGDRVRHLRTHTGERPYICQTCGKPFPDSSGLSQHMKFHKNIKSYVCSVCSKSFVFPSELRRHMRIHTGEKPFLCYICGKGFRESIDLKVHTRNHTGERPFTCTECDRAFKSKKLLNLHVRTHTVHKPHACKICGVGFARAEVLAIHIRTHTGEKHYSSDICEKAFKSWESLISHKQTHNKRK